MAIVLIEGVLGRGDWIVLVVGEIVNLRKVVVRAETAVLGFEEGSEGDRLCVMGDTGGESVRGMGGIWILSY